MQALSVLMFGCVRGHNPVSVDDGLMQDMSNHAKSQRLLDCAGFQPFLLDRPIVINSCIIATNVEK